MLRSKHLSFYILVWLLTYLVVTIATQWPCEARQSYYWANDITMDGCTGDPIAIQPFGFVFVQNMELKFFYRTIIGLAFAVGSFILQYCLEWIFLRRFRRRKPDRSVKTGKGETLAAGLCLAGREAILLGIPCAYIMDFSTFFDIDDYCVNISVPDWMATLQFYGVVFAFPLSCAVSSLAIVLINRESIFLDDGHSDLSASSSSLDPSIIARNSPVFRATFRQSARPFDFRAFARVQ